MSVGGVGMDPGPSPLDSANGASARVKGSSLPYLIPLSGAIASATPAGQLWTGGRVNLGPKPVFAHSTLPQGVGRGLFRPPQPVQKPTGDWGCLGCGWVPHAKRGGEGPPRGGGSEVRLYASRRFALVFQLEKLEFSASPLISMNIFDFQLDLEFVLKTMDLSWSIQILLRLLDFS